MSEKQPNRYIYTWKSPDGQEMKKITGNHIDHSIAVMGYMRLRKALPKVDPKDPKEETRYEHFKQWILIGTVENEVMANRLVGCNGYRGATEQVQFIPLMKQAYTPTKNNTDEVDDG